MKKVNIITRHAVSNYGSLMQTIATVDVFKQLGYKCEVIDYLNSNEEVLNSLKNFALNRNLNGLKKLAYIVLKYPSEKKKYKIFNKMRKTYLPLTKRYSNSKEMKNAFNNEILCSGGDQLWGYMPNNQLDTAYYLDFANDTNKCISFSSSFGRYDFNDNEKEVISSNLKKYSFITVREESAVKYINNFNLDAKLVLDPTLLVEKKLWHQLANDYKPKEDFVLVYKLRQDEKLNNLAERIANENGLKIIYITNTVFNKNSNGKTLVNKKLSIVLSLFKNANYVVTDSFHATVLSIIFEKKFCTHLPGKTNARIIDFLDMLSISERIYYDVEFYSYNDEINYLKVNSILEEKKKIDLEYIRKKMALL